MHLFQMLAIHKSVGMKLLAVLTISALKHHYHEVVTLQRFKVRTFRDLSHTYLASLL